MSYCVSKWTTVYIGAKIPAVCQPWMHPPPPHFQTRAMCSQSCTGNIMWCMRQFTLATDISSSYLLNTIIPYRQNPKDSSRGKNKAHVCIIVSLCRGPRKLQCLQVMVKIKCLMHMFLLQRGGIKWQTQ